VSRKAAYTFAYAAGVAAMVSGLLATPSAARAETINPEIVTYSLFDVTATFAGYGTDTITGSFAVSYVIRPEDVGPNIVVFKSSDITVSGPLLSGVYNGPWGMNGNPAYVEVCSDCQTTFMYCRLNRSTQHRR